MDWLKRNISALVSIVSAIILVFLSGIAWAHLQLPGATLVRNTIDAAQDWRANAPAYLGRVPLKHLQPRRFKEDGLVLSDTGHAAPGVTFMTGLFGQKLGARLYAVDGTLIHEWPTNFFDVARDAMRYPFDALLHGDYLYPNGDILTNVDGVGLFRVSACGDVRWQNRAGSHHSLFVDEEGFLWTPIKAKEYRDTALRKEPFNFDRVAKFNADTGAMLEEIDLVKMLEDSQLEGLALSNRMIAEDTMHLNDVEVLSSAMAPAFPDFTAGDLLLSSRNFSQLWVVDRKTRRLKWWYAGPIIGQHDPDFQPDGTITVFDNHPNGKSPGESRILRIDPKTKDYETVYAGRAGNNFFSAYRGKHQLLENGNLLITETDAGRVFEVTKEGQMVWSFINGWDEDRVAWIMSATRYPPEYASIGQIQCASK
jgi:hypothetical protein